MSVPTLRVFVDFDSDTAFEVNPLILGSATKGILGTNRLGSGTLPVEITDLVTRVAIRRGRNRITSKFEPGTADIVLYDQNGDWNPANPNSAYYPNLVPLRQIIIYATYAGVDYYIFSGFISKYDTGFRQGNEDLSTVTYTLTCTWTTLANLEDYLGITFTNPSTDYDRATFAVNAANQFAYRRRQESGYFDASLTTVPGADVLLGTVMYAGALYREAGSIDQFASFDPLATGAPVGGSFGQILRLLGCNRPQVA